MNTTCALWQKNKLIQLLLTLILIFSPLTFADDRDPWEGFNRAVFEFNEVFDKYLLKPVAIGYQYITPEIIDDGVTNIFSNLGEIRTAVNSILQGKISDATSDTGRFLINSTVGLAGFFDVATTLGLEKHQEDFGQTLAVWGIDSGPYLVLPFFGPSTIRDALSKAPDSFLSPQYYIDNDAIRYSLYALEVVDMRADLIAKEKLIKGDKYTFFKDVYLQRRDFLINDGQLEEDEFLEENF